MQILNATRLALLTAFLLFTSIGVLAQEPSDEPSASPTPQSAATPSPAPLPTASPSPRPKVTSVTGNVELDDIIEIKVENLEKWAETNDPSKLVPYIDGRAIKGNYPEELHIERGRVIYHLELIPENKKVWIDLLGAPSAMRRPVAVSVGLENGSAFDSIHGESNPLPLTVIAPVYGILALVVIFVTLLLLLWLVRKTNIIREPGPPPGPGKHRPYNLGRAQMAFWFFLVYASYMTIWLITDALDTITASLLALMGISAGTALGEAMIDSGKDTAKTNQFQDLTAERLALEQSVIQAQSDLDSLNAATTVSAADQTTRDGLNRQLVDGRTRIGQIDQQLRTLSSQTSATVSSGFLRDILADSSGYSFHRFQIFAWTIVLGIIFVSSVYNNLYMPEFSPTLLGLMGLSAGTYIGFKFPEQK
jgi:hypothetical protein